MRNTTHKGTALITGASSGIGAIYADRLAHRGYDLILVARNRDRLETLSKRLREQTGRDVEIVVADLGAKKDLLVVEEILRSNERITTLINNAGIGAVNSILDTDVNRMESLIALNVTALTRLTYAAAPQFVARAKGTIINIASVVAIRPEQLNGVYGASKAFVLAFTQSLQAELASKGIRIQAVLPGATRTEFWDAAHRPVDQLPQEIVMSAEDMVDAAISGLDQGEIVTIPPLQNGDLWTNYEAMRAEFGLGNLSVSTPAPRYGFKPVAKAA